MPEFKTQHRVTADRLMRELSVVAITDPDGIEHLVQDWAVGEHANTGRYPTRCGAWVFSGSMCDPPGKPCALCLVVPTTYYSRA